MKIVIKSDDIQGAEAQRIRFMIKKMFERGVFNIRHGHVELHFGSDGELANTKFVVDQWRRNKESRDTLHLYEKVLVNLSE